MAAQMFLTIKVRVPVADRTEAKTITAWLKNKVAERTDVELHATVSSQVQIVTP